MANFSIGGKKYEDKTLYTVGTADPGQVATNGSLDVICQIRVVADRFSSHEELMGHLERLIQKMRELKEPRELSV